jgi:predicted ATPase
MDRSGGQFYSEAFGFNLGAFCRVYVGHCEWHLGYPDRALSIAEAGLALARETSHPFSIALALDYLGMLHQFRRDPDQVLTIAEEAHALCVEHRFDYYRAWSALLRAWAIAERGAVEEGLAAYSAALVDFRGTGSEIRLPHYLIQLAAIHRSANRQSAALQCLAEAAAFAKKNAESWCDAELERERGEAGLLSATPDRHQKAAEAFRRAIKIAVAQGAKLLELRAATALARLLAEQGHRREAHEQLAPICGWFTEGAATPDLLQARNLLDTFR